MGLLKLSNTGRIYLFLLVPAIIASQFFDFPNLFNLLKPLIIPLLIFEVYRQSRPYHDSLNVFRWLYAALVLSWFGDVFLIFESGNSIFFILGLASFLLAHIGYIVMITRTSEVSLSSSLRSRKSRYVIFIVFYAAVFLIVLNPGLGAMKVPVFVYALVLMSMAATAILRTASGSLVVISGAILFVLSDSILAYAKFISAFPGSRELTMLTYMLAQFLLVNGLLSAADRKD